MSKVLFLLLAVVLFCGMPAFAQTTTEEITITTYYPSPYGVYEEMNVGRRMSIGDFNGDGVSNAADLPVDNFGNPLNDSLAVAGNVGIGIMNPTNGRLGVDGEINFAPQPAAPVGNQGDLYYDLGINGFRYHDGTNWLAFGGGGDFIPIMPVLFSPTPVGTWTALDLSSAIPAGTKEVGGSVRVRATGGVAAFAIASRSDGTGQKEIFFQGDVSGGTLLASSFRLSLLEDRRLYHISAGLSYNEIKISEHK